MDGAAYDFNAAVTGDITLKAKWEKIETPTDPTEPGKPTDPTEPTEPSKPTVPQEPDDPVTPETGDNSNLLFWSALMFVSFFCVATVLVLGKKKLFTK